MTKDALIEGFKLPHETEEDFLKTVPPIMFELVEETPTEADIEWGKKNMLASTTLGLELNGEELRQRIHEAVAAMPCRVYSCVNGTVLRKSNGYFKRVPCPACHPSN